MLLRETAKCKIRTCYVLICAHSIYGRQINNCTRQLTMDKKREGEGNIVSTVLPCYHHGYLLSALKNELALDRKREKVNESRPSSESTTTKPQPFLFMP